MADHQISKPEGPVAIAKAEGASLNPLDPIARFNRSKLKQYTNIEIVVASILFIAIVILAVFGAFLQTHDPMQGDLMARFAKAGEKDYLLGSDHLGRDLWSRAGFNNLAHIHHGDVVRDVSHDCDVVRDKEVAELKLFLKVEEQI